MKQRKFYTLADLGSKAGKNAIFGRKRVRIHTVITEKVIPGQPYEPTLDQRLRRKREEVRQLRRLEQPTSKQAVQIFIFGDPVLYRIEDLQAIQSSGWHYTIVEVGFETITKRW
jgi:hypothetical protein